MLKQVHWPLWQGKFDGKYTLDIIRQSLDAIGNPEKKIPFPIHILGTNGKGSTTAFLESILKEAGFVSHVYTSPNLIFLNERIKIAGKFIEDEEMISSLNELKYNLSQHNLDTKISFFEGLTALAFMLFSKNKADFSLIEAGLGGRLDATNVIDSKICVLTSVSLDHTEVLGNSLKEIVNEKISLQTTAPFICAKQPYAEVQNILQEKENFYIYGRDYELEILENKNFKFHSKNYHIHLSEPNLKGFHQYYNAGTAIKVCEILNQIYGIKISNEHIAQGLQKAVWPARMQSLSLFGIDFYLDGGHNEDGIKMALEYFLNKHPEGDVIFGVLSRKNLSNILPQFKNVKHLHTVAIHSTESSRSAEELTQAFEAEGIDVSSCNEYFYEALKQTKVRGVLILGSLYLAGEVLEYIQNYGKS